MAKAEKLGDRKVRFSFVPGGNRELPLILGQMPVLSRPIDRIHPFDQTTLEPPLGSGPYRIERSGQPQHHPGPRARCGGEIWR